MAPRLSGENAFFPGWSLAPKTRNCRVLVLAQVDGGDGRVLHAPERAAPGRGWQRDRRPGVPADGLFQVRGGDLGLELVRSAAAGQP